MEKDERVIGYHTNGAVANEQERVWDKTHARAHEVGVSIVLVPALGSVV